MMTKIKRFFERTTDLTRTPSQEQLSARVRYLLRVEAIPELHRMYRQTEGKL